LPFAGIQRKRRGMKALSEQLIALPDRTKKTEDVVARGVGVEPVTLKSQRARLKTSIEAGHAKSGKSATRARGKAGTRPSDTAIFGGPAIRADARAEARDGPADRRLVL
jgi:hypothetical protein